MIYLYVKGNATEALQAVRDHGIHPTDVLVGPYVFSPFSERPDYLVSEFFVRDVVEPGVERWNDETNARLIADNQFPQTRCWPAGTLLHRFTDQYLN